MKQWNSTGWHVLLLNWTDTQELDNARQNVLNFPGPQKKKKISILRFFPNPPSQVCTEIHMVILQFLLHLQFTSPMATTWHNPTRVKKLLWKIEHNLEQNSAWRAPCPKEPNKTFPLALLFPFQEEPSRREAVSVTASFAESVKLFGDMTSVLALGFPTENSIKNYPLQGPNIFTLNLSESLKSIQPVRQQIEQTQQTSICYSTATSKATETL